MGSSDVGQTSSFTPIPVSSVLLLLSFLMLGWAGAQHRTLKANGGMAEQEGGSRRLGVGEEEGDEGHMQSTAMGLEKVREPKS